MGRYDTLDIRAYALNLREKVPRDPILRRTFAVPTSGPKQRRRPTSIAVMPLSPDALRRLAELARIGLSEAEVQSVRANLDSIFGLIDKLQAIPTQGIKPLAHAHDTNVPLRDDVVTERDRHALYQSVAPAVEEGLYLVPKVIE